MRHTRDDIDDRGEVRNATGAAVLREPFGRAPDGGAVELFTLVNGQGIEVRAITYGGIIVSLRTPDRDGRIEDIVLGHDDVAGYGRSGAYFGAVVGRYGNRIARGRFTIDGVVHQVSTNDGANHLHGGVHGFDKATWEAACFERPEGVGVVLTHTSPAGDEGYPGTLSARVSYTLTAADELIVDYHATTDRATPVNLTQHSYFNLAGAGRGDVLGHELTLHASRYLPVDATLVPTGALVPVAGTPFDFRRPARIGARIGEADPQLRIANGYDHTFVLDAFAAGSLAHAARLVEPTTGRTLDVHTTEPGVQLYTANFLDGVSGKEGRRYGRRSGVCLETQHFPDSPNHPEFPSTVLRPGSEYRSRTVFTFGAA